MRDSALRVWLASLLLGCGGVSALRDEPIPSATEPAPRFYLVDQLERGPVVVLDADFHVEERLLRDDEDEPSAEEIEPAPEVVPPPTLTVVGPDGVCRGRPGRALLVTHESVPYERPSDSDESDASDDDVTEPLEPPLYVSRHTALVIELEAPCEGVLAIDAPPSTVSWRHAARVQYEVLPAQGDHVIALGADLDLLEHRGAPIDEICPALPEYTLRVRGQPRFRIEEVDVGRVRGALIRDDHVWLVFEGGPDRTVLDTDSGVWLGLSVPSRVDTDWEASPCL